MYSTTALYQFNQLEWSKYTIVHVHVHQYIASQETSAIQSCTRFKVVVMIFYYWSYKSLRWFCTLWFKRFSWNSLAKARSDSKYSSCVEVSCWYSRMSRSLTSTGETEAKCWAWEQTLLRWSLVRMRRAFSRKSWLESESRLANASHHPSSCK